MFWGSEASAIAAWAFVASSHWNSAGWTLNWRTAHVVGPLSGCDSPGVCMKDRGRGAHADVRRRPSALCVIRLHGCITADALAFGACFCIALIEGL